MRILQYALYRTRTVVWELEIRSVRKDEDALLADIYMERFGIARTAWLYGASCLSGSKLLVEKCGGTNILQNHPADGCEMTFCLPLSLFY